MTVAFEATIVPAQECTPRGAPHGASRGLRRGHGTPLPAEVRGSRGAPPRHSAGRRWPWVSLVIVDMQRPEGTRVRTEQTRAVSVASGPGRARRAALPGARGRRGSRRFVRGARAPGRSAVPAEPRSRLAPPRSQSGNGKRVWRSRSGEAPGAVAGSDRRAGWREGHLMLCSRRPASWDSSVCAP